MVLIFEDWHWADDASMVALAHLGGQALDCRLLVLVLHRPELKAEWTSLPRHTGLALQPLALSDTEAIIRSVLRTRRLPAGFGTLVHERTAGNPFFTEELASAVVARGHVISTGDEIRVAGPLETLDLPETVQATIRARVDRLTPVARETLRVASVLGREFARRVLEAVMRADAPLPLALEQLAAQDLIQPVRLLPEPEYIFKHVLIQAVMYETLLHQQRKVLHVRAGAAIEAVYPERLEEHYEALAHHYGHSADTAKGTQYLELAGDKAAKVFSLAAARRHYQDAIALLDAADKTPEHLGRRVDITLKLAKASHYAASNETLGTLEVARGYAQRLDDRHRMVQVASWMGGIYRMLGDHKRVLVVLGECAQLAEALADEEMLASAYHVMGRACYLTGDYRKGIDFMARGIDISERLGNLAEVSYSVGFSADCHAWLGEFDRALPLVERSMRLALDSGDISRQGGANWYQAAVFCMQGEWDRGLQAAVRCSEFARRIGGAYLQGAGISAHGWATFALGEKDQGIALMQEGLRMMEASGSRQGTGLYASWIADACAVADRYDEAVEYANKALAFLYQFGEGNGEAPSHRALAIAAALQARPDWPLVEHHIGESLRAADTRGERPQRAISLLRHGELLRRQGDKRRAAERLSEAHRAFDAMGMRWWVEQASGLLD
jgi:tetratricopeptide (TPR) repeat protein